MRFTRPSIRAVSPLSRLELRHSGAPASLLCLGTRLHHTPLSTGESMAKKPNKTKSKRRSTAIFKAKRSGSKPLMAKAASVRTAKPSASMSRASDGKTPTSPFSPARSGSKPLMAEAASMHTPKPSTSMSGASNGKPPTSPLNPALTVIAMMGRVMGAYAEFPARLAQCRSPMDILSEHARFVQRVFSASPVSADRPLRAQSQ